MLLYLKLFYIYSVQHLTYLMFIYAQILITSAFKRDAEFLSRHEIIDYSLLVGIDVDNNQVVIGIIGLFVSVFFNVYACFETTFYKTNFNNSIKVFYLLAKFT